MSSETTNPYSPISPALATSWTTHVNGINALGESILASRWQPTAILGISRGGLIPAAILSYMLDVRLIQAVRVQHYDDQDNRLEAGPQFIEGPQPFVTFNIETQRLLVVDDIVDTGETLKLVLEAVQPHADEVKVAALYVRSNQTHSADWYWKIEDEWVVFPWAPER